jgi:hypothetical protein
MSTHPIEIDHPKPLVGDALQLADFVRYIGVNIRASSFAFLLIENGTVLDSGIRKCELPEFHNCLSHQFDRILLTYKPSVAIISSSAGVNSKKRVIRRKLRSAAVKRAVDLIAVKRPIIKHYFARYNAVTKYEVAQAVADIFPDLIWKLPPKRRVWQREDSRMSIFDAAAAVITYLMVE